MHPRLCWNARLGAGNDPHSCALLWLQVLREDLQKLLAGLVEQTCRLEAVHGQDLRLEGKLRLALALVQVLGRNSFDDSRLGSALAFRLLTGELLTQPCRPLTARERSLRDLWLLPG